MEPFQLRNVYNPQVIQQLAERIKKTYPSFDEIGFCMSINAQLDALNFGDRSKLIRKNLKAFLPNYFVKAANILVDSLGPELVIEPGKTDWDGFINVSLAEFIAVSTQKNAISESMDNAFLKFAIAISFLPKDSYNKPMQL